MCEGKEKGCEKGRRRDVRREGEGIRVGEGEVISEGEGKEK